jgi:hypothetical protein
MRTDKLAFALCSLLFACGSDHHDDDGAHEEGAHDAGLLPDGAVDLEGAQMCCHLGEICHEGDTGEGSSTGACHDLGHQNDPEGCRTMYEACLDLCVPAGESRALPDSCEDPFDEETDHRSF